ncbi:MAG TPA: ADP-ribosylglycohydrolase family protein [Gemmatimonadales bacterium]|nr:ADP-ribosylglycohydrolase family protein [Gemmatimonadales bacterium]
MTDLKMSAPKHNRATPDLGSRARGAFLGHAAGNALGVPTEFLGTPEAIQREFPGGLAEIRRRDTPASPWDDDVAMAVALAEELLEPEPDLERLTKRWVRWMEEDGRGIGGWTRTALLHIRTHGAPPAASGGQAGNGAVMRALPVALRFFRQPANLIAATYHTAALTHPDPRCGWSAVAVNVAAACFLAGRRDFVGDVIEALRNNDAPAEVTDAVRRVPIQRREELPILGGAAGFTVHTMQVGLWAAYHEPSLERALLWLANAGGDTDTNAAVAGGLLGARDGAEAVPARWVAAVARAEHLAELAERLVGLR